MTAEFVVQTGGGIGSYMAVQQNATHTPELYGAILAAALLGYLVNVGLRAVERRADLLGRRRAEGRPVMVRAARSLLGVAVLVLAFGAWELWARSSGSFTIPEPSAVLPHCG